MRSTYRIECHQPKKAVQPTYKCCASDLQRLCIQPSNEIHPTHKYCASDLQKRATNIRKLCNRPDTLFFFNEVCNRPTVHWTNSSLKLLKNHVQEGPKYRRTDVTLGWCNTIQLKGLLTLFQVSLLVKISIPMKEKKFQYLFICKSGFCIYAEETKKDIDRIHSFSMRKDRIS